jgi:ribonuclease HI
MDNFVIRKNGRTTSNKQPINIYTDGACSNNGKPNAKAGFGVWFGDDDARNISQPVPENGRQTNNVAELLAIVTALTVVRDDIEERRIVHIYTDSEYSLRCCTSYGEKMYKKGWKNKGKDIPNRKIVEVAYDFCSKYPNIKFHHIAAHTGLQDEHSVGNDHADRLANIAIGVESCPYNNKSSKIYLNVPFSEKNEAKKMGAKWDAKKKKWFVENKNRHKIQMMGRWG